MNNSIVKAMSGMLLVGVIALTSTFGLAQRPAQAAAPAAECTTPTLFNATGNDAASLQADVDAFRNAIGALNANSPFNHVDGRRQIDWDAAPDAVSAPTAFPGDFFNANVFPRARGIEFTTPGTELQLSATAASGAGIEFDNIDPIYSAEFTTFSAERLFAPIGSNLVDVHFFSPANQTTPAQVDSFGVVFIDVNQDNVTKLEFYDVDDNLIHTQFVAARLGSETLSLAGVKFAQPCIFRVRITTGNIGLENGVTEAEDGNDVVVMDDFIYGEPQPITSCGTPEVITASGADAAAIQAQVDAYRESLGDLNPFEPQNFPTGRRQIDWDAAPDVVSAPNAFPGNFFNFNAAPRARGIEFSTNGDSLQLSASAASGAGIDFDNINGNYSATFEAFSLERLFTAIGSHTVDARFFDPATQSGTALTNGFGAVFSDVDLDNVTVLKYYDANNKLVFALSVPAFASATSNNQQSFSFAGLKFDTACVARVRLVNGNEAIAAAVNDDPANAIELVVMDDFIYGEPQPAQIDVNAALNLINVQKTFARTPQANAKFGVFTIQAEFKNVSDSQIQNMSFVVTELSNGNTLLNSTNSVLGVGASLPIPAADLGADGVLAPEESFTVAFVVGINRLKPFTLLVNAFGSISEDVDATVDLGWNYLLDSNPEAAAQEADNQTYLPSLLNTAPAQ